MKRIFCAVIVFAVLLNVTFGSVQAAEKAKVKPPPAVAAPAPVIVPVPVPVPAKVPAIVVPEPAKVPPVIGAPAEKKEMSREDMVTRVKELCQYHPDMLAAIPGLAAKEVDGKKVYEFNGKRLDDLDKDTIAKIFGEANRFISFQNTQRFQQQMKTMKQIDDINKMNRQLRKPYNPNIPKTYTPPKTYNPPKPYKAPGK